MIILEHFVEKKGGIIYYFDIFMGGDDHLISGDPQALFSAKRILSFSC